jgi:hypothetical protein
VITHAYAEIFRHTEAATLEDTTPCYAFARAAELRQRRRAAFTQESDGHGAVTPMMRLFSPPRLIRQPPRLLPPYERSHAITFIDCFDLCATPIYAAERYAERYAT